LDRAVANLQRALDMVGDNAVLYAGLDTPISST